MAEHDYETISSAIRNTFERVRIEMPSEPPMALTENFGANEMKQTQWTAFLHRNSTLDAPADFKEIVACVSQFLSPVFYHAEITPKKWIPGVGWQN